MEWSLSTHIAQLYTFGSSNDTHTFHVNSQWLSWPGTSCSFCHQSGMSTCQVHHSAFSMGEGLVSSLTPVLARNVSSLLKNSSSPPSTLDQSELSHIMPSVPQVSWGIWWALSTPASLSRLSSEDEGGLLSVKVTHLFCQLGEWASLQPDITWGSSLCHPEDWDLQHWQLPECQQLPKHWQPREWLILSIFSSNMAAVTRACWWAYLLRANTSMHESHCRVANCSYVAQCVAANSAWGSGL